ncbi:unnamed protein product [Periconia digitata]|uniref:Rhodopsin domain-containing protein n=1 Tax=Periconia digitata TaxID=1303443 RepID=A0A9W4UAJ1_9PLEO|nr:unnamed protein product [Periconia digitata]
MSSATIGFQSDQRLSTLEVLTIHLQHGKSRRPSESPPSDLSLSTTAASERRPRPAILPNPCPPTTTSKHITIIHHTSSLPTLPRTPSSIMSTQKQSSLITSGLLVVSVIFPLLAFASIILRWKSRRVSKQNFGSDDWSILISWITTFALSVHVWVFTPMIGIDYYSNPSSVSKSLQCLFLASALVQIPLASVKISILLFYRRIFSVGIFKRIVIVVAGLIACWGIIIFVLMLNMYDNITTAWGKSTGSPRYDPAKFGYAQVGSSIALDVLVLCLPLPLVSRLHLEWKRKVAVALIFCLGFVCVIAATARFIVLHRSLHLVLESSGNSAVHLQSQNFILMIIEPNISVVAACLPCYGPLVKGGRSQMSLINSVRSMFSLRSRQDYAQYGSGRSEGNSATESQIELRKGRMQANYVAERFSDEGGEVQQGGINVTRNVQVVRS